MPLTIDQMKFSELVVMTGKISESYLKTYDCKDVSQQQVYQRANNLFSRPEIRAYIDELRIKITQMDTSTINIAGVLKEYIDIALADPNELVQYRRLNCRHCWGADHHYQWVSETEMAQVCAKIMEDNSKIPAGKPKKEMPDISGGHGFMRNRPPHPECPNCLGDGEPDVFIPDTNLLTGRARKLYAGVKQTQHGVQIMMRDQDGALEKIARIFGMFKDGAQVVVLPPGAEPVVTLPTDPDEAARVYKMMIDK